jgi:hypothetical protein
MESRVRMFSVTGLLALLCIPAVLLPIGCQHDNRVVQREVREVCPVCERETRVHPITGLTYTTCICPTCERVLTLDMHTREAIERFTGPNIGDRVQVCDSCGNIVEDCAVCRQRHVRGH